MKLTRAYTHGDRVIGEFMRDSAEALARVLEVEIVELDLDPALLPRTVKLRRVVNPRSVSVANIAERDDPSAIPVCGGVVWDKANGLRVRGLGGSLSNGTVYRVSLRVEGD
jgi:hypothetical protein